MYLVMELCGGGELADALKEKKYYMESEVKVITKELASAIAYLHKKGRSRSYFLQNSLGQVLH